MKNFQIIFLFALLPFLSMAQPMGTWPLSYGDTPPTHTPAGSGTRLYFNTATNELYSWAPAPMSQWLKYPKAFDQISGCSAPGYTPTARQSTFAVNSCSPKPELYVYSGGSWACLNCYTNYTAGTGINISGGTISNTGDLSSSNEIQTLSIAGQNLSLSLGGGTVAIPADDALGNGFVNGGGEGNIPANTVANLSTQFKINTANGQILIGDESGNNYDLKMYVNPNFISFGTGNGSYSYVLDPDSERQAFVSPAGQFEMLPGEMLFSMASEARMRVAYSSGSYSGLTINDEDGLTEFFSKNGNANMSFGNNGAQMAYYEVGQFLIGNGSSAPGAFYRDDTPDKLGIQYDSYYPDILDTDNSLTSTRHVNELIDRKVVGSLGREFEDGGGSGVIISAVGKFDPGAVLNLTYNNDQTALQITDDEEYISLSSKSGGSTLEVRNGSVTMVSDNINTTSVGGISTYNYLSSPVTFSADPSINDASDGFPFVGFTTVSGDLILQNGFYDEGGNPSFLFSAVNTSTGDIAKFLLSNGYAGLSANGSTGNSSIQATATSLDMTVQGSGYFLINDNSTVKTGLEYAARYPLIKVTARAIPDVGLVKELLHDSLLTVGALGRGFTNGGGSGILPAGSEAALEEEASFRITYFDGSPAMQMDDSEGRIEFNSGNGSGSFYFSDTNMGFSGQEMELNAETSLTLNTPLINTPASSYTTAKIGSAGAIDIQYSNSATALKISDDEEFVEIRSKDGASFLNFSSVGTTIQSPNVYFSAGTTITPQTGANFTIDLAPIMANGDLFYIGDVPNNVYFLMQGSSYSFQAGDASFGAFSDGGAGEFNMNSTAASLILSTTYGTFQIKDVPGSEFTFYDARSVRKGVEYSGDYSADIIANPASITDVRSVNKLKQKPVSYTNAAAPNDTIFYSTTDSKLSYKDSGGTVHGLY